MEAYVEVFKTNVEHIKEADKVLAILISRFPECSFNFDLEDCDKVLRAKGVVVNEDIKGVMQVVAAIGYQIEVLPG